MPRSIPDPLLSGLSDFVAERMGLHFPRERWRDLERGIVAATPELDQPDVESCIRWLLSASMTRSHIEILASHLTVGETYFFREKRGLEILETEIIPELLRPRRDGERYLRIWSAGCCTGEEPYSIAMLLDRLIPDYDDWNITLLATDINPRFLRKAAAGIYGDWSFRETPEWIKSRYFKKRKDGRFELSAHITGKVAFSYLNLADDVYPSLLNGTNAMDVIFCRNVLMYFTAQRAKQVARNLHRSLLDDGWLIVNPAEASNTLCPLFTPVEFPGAVFYRKTEDQPQQCAATGYQELTRQSTLVPMNLVESGASTEMQADPPGETLTTGPRDTRLHDQHAHEALSFNARTCANQGQLADAITWCEKAIAADKMNPAHHYLLAVIQQEQGQADAAVQSLKNALYIDPEFSLAHFALGNLRLSQGRHQDAARHFTNTLATLRTHPNGEILSGAEGLSVERLVEIVTSVLASLPRAAVVDM